MILVTGAAGFIGFHVSLRLLKEGHDVHAIDNLNGYYDVGLKEARVRILESHPGFALHRVDLADAAAMKPLFARISPGAVLHFAAQAGVRHSLVDPRAYASSNLDGFLNVLEGCRAHHVKHLVFASSSSVYGLNSTLPFSVHHSTDHPVSFYAATKKANELMAHSYSHLFGIPTSGLRLFTVYGPWGRPDMALFTFTRAILEGRPVEIFGDGTMRRDFTFIDDVVEAILRLTSRAPEPDPAWGTSRPDPASSSAPFRIYNIGNRSTVDVSRLVDVLETSLLAKAVRKFVPAGGCEIQAAAADTLDLEREIGFTPATPLDVGVRRFVDWFRGYYKI